MSKLELIFTSDQETLKQLSSGLIDLAEAKKRQDENLKLFKEYLKIEGFPFKNKFDVETYKKAIVLALHGDIETMTFVLKFIENKDTTKIDCADKAYLIDKIKVMDGIPQLYGTQFKRVDADKIEFFEIEDLANVNQRRKVLGMTTLEEYERFATGK